MANYLNSTGHRDVKKYVVIDGKLSLNAAIVSKEERNGDFRYKVRFNSSKEFTYRSSRCRIVSETEVIQGPFVLSVCKNRNWTQIEYDRGAEISVIHIPGETRDPIVQGAKLRAKDSEHSRKKLRRRRKEQ